MDGGASAGRGLPAHPAVQHTNIRQAEDLEKACRKAFGKAPLVVFELGGVVSANTGPDTVALTYTGHPRG